LIVPAEEGGGGVGVGVEHGLVAPAIVARLDLFPAASRASTPSV